jgi:hypothetical protein
VNVPVGVVTNHVLQGIGEEIEPIMTGAVKDSLILSFSSSLKTGRKNKRVNIDFLKEY